jgi:prophage antirepressor-like protein
MTNQLAKPSVDFTFEHHEIRTVIRNGEPWFIATDVCKALELSNPSKAVASLDDDEKQLFSGDSNLKLGSAGNGAQSMIIINESGLYTLILRCRDAVKQGTLPWRFRKWVTNDVLPSIRKTGRYQIEEKHQVVPVFRYIITLHYRDVLTGQEETLCGGANTPEEIVRGTAKKFGVFIPEMKNMPVNAYY